MSEELRRRKNFAVFVVAAADAALVEAVPEAAAGIALYSRGMSKLPPAV